MTDILSTKEIIHRTVIGIPRGLKKCNLYFCRFQEHKTVQHNVACRVIYKRSKLGS